MVYNLTLNVQEAFFGAIIGLVELAKMMLFFNFNF